jgi:hypothetical protein
VSRSISFVVNALWNHRLTLTPGDFHTLETHLLVAKSRLQRNAQVPAPLEPCPWFDETVAEELEEGLSVPMTWAEALAMSLDHANRQRNVTTTHYSEVVRFADRGAGLRPLRELEGRRKSGNRWWVMLGL